MKDVSIHLSILPFTSLILFKSKDLFIDFPLLFGIYFIDRNSNDVENPLNSLYNKLLLVDQKGTSITTLTIGGS